MTGPIESLGSVRLKGLLLLVMMFAAGALVGASVMRMRPPVPPIGGRPGGPPFMRGGPGGGLPPFVAERLGLTAEQRTRIDAIFAAARPQSDSMLAVVMPRLRAIADSTRDAVEAVLTEEQRALLREMRATRGPGGPPTSRRPSGTPAPR